MTVRSMVGAVSWAVLIGASACNGGALNSPVTDVDGSTPPIDAGMAPSDGGTPAWADVLCAPPLGERLWVQSPDDMRTTLTGQWVLCSADGLFAQSQAGVEIGADDRWRLLAWSAGQLAVQPGLDHAGAMEYLDATQGGQVLVQVNFVGDIGGTIVSIPVVSDSPRQLLINNNGVVTYLYARVP